jgi:hypothetical protein
MNMYGHVTDWNEVIKKEVRGATYNGLAGKIRDQGFYNDRQHDNPQMHCQVLIIRNIHLVSQYM